MQLPVRRPALGGNYNQLNWPLSFEPVHRIRPLVTVQVTFRSVVWTETDLLLKIALPIGFGRCDRRRLEEVQLALVVGGTESE